MALTAANVLANVTGAVLVFVFAFFLLPLQDAFAPEQQQANKVAFVVYLVFSVVVGQIWGSRVARACQAWLSGDAPANDRIRIDLLRLPLRQTIVNATMWAGAAGVFGLLNGLYSRATILDLSSTILLGGLATCGLTYLLSERLLRPAVSLAMQGTTTPPPVLLGVRPRLVLAWLLGSGIPLAETLLGVTVPGGRHAPLSTGGVSFLVLIGLVVGFLAILTAAGAVADPVRSVAEGLRAVGAGDREVAVPVYDASEIGQLQSGFNAMVTGLRERDRLRDLYGRQVGDDVAKRALEHGAELGGELRDVAVLFVDVVGSTALAQLADPQEVVRRLNAFFAVVIAAVQTEGGWVNKFEGDAALCIFGAPVARTDPRADALRAARRLRAGLSGLDVAAVIGIAAGQVVAGHVGAESRFEYTVIGDAVNVAARLTELAKDEAGGVLADAAVLTLADPAESTHWQAAEAVELRGRTGPVTLARPEPV